MHPAALNANARAGSSRGAGLSTPSATQLRHIARTGQARNDVRCRAGQSQLEALNRRDALCGALALGVASLAQLPVAQPAAAIQGLTAGRIPGACPAR